ncbi:hypothetical protein Tco_0907349 [Tanacetum coccineum]|uniref:Uncharacterized protein n=1 Tax=Tanacetum coccineum TaxID=301880 RepID=A0ABQ5CQC9_9ASTR
MEESLSKFMVKSAKRHKENSNLIKEIRASTYTAIKNQGASIKALEIQIRQISKVLQERGSVNLPSSTEINPRDHVKSILTTVDADTTPIRHIGSSRRRIRPTGHHLYNDCYDDEEGSYGLKDLDANSIGATLLDNALPTKEKDPIIRPVVWDYIELNDLNEPLELRRNQVDDLEPTMEEGEVVDEPIMDIVKTMYEYVNVNFFRLLSINVMSKSCPKHDAYRDDGMGDIIVGRPFCLKACVKARRFDGMITIHKGNDSMRSLLKVSAQDELKGILHPYQKLKGFYKEVLNLGLDYIKNEKVEEWLTYGHVSIHEME